MTTFFLYLYNYFQRHQAIFFVLFFGHLLVFGYFAARIRPSEDIASILPKEKQTEKLNDILRNAKFADKLVVMISITDSSLRAPDSLLAFSDAFTNKMKTGYPDYIRTVTDAVNDSLFPAVRSIVQSHLPIYLSAADYASMDSLLTPENVRRSLDRDLHTLTSPAGLVMRDILSQDPLGIASPALRKLRRLQYDENFELYQNHVITKDGRYMLLFVSPAFPPDNTAKNAKLLQGIDETFFTLQKTFPGVSAEYFGAVAVSAGNAVQLRKDSILTLSITVIFLVVFIGGYFRKKRAPVLILIPVLSGALFSLAVIYLLKGTISVIALAAGSVVLGIAINYSLHVYNHFRHTRDLRQVISDLSFPLTIGSFTSIGGFACLEFVRSEMLKDLGLFAALSLVGAALSSLIFLPQLNSEHPSNKRSAETVSRNSWIDRLSRFHPERSRYIVAGIFGLTILFSFFAPRVHFDSDMMNMNFMPGNLRTSEATLNHINEYSLRSVYLITDGRTMEDALMRNERLGDKIDALEQRQVIKKSSAAFSLLLSDSLQRTRITRWNAYWTAEKKNNLLQLLNNEAGRLGFRPGAFAPFDSLLGKPAATLDAAEKTVLLKGFAEDYMMTKPNQVSLVNLLSVLPGDRQKMYDAFGNENKVTVVDRQYLASKLVSIVNLDFSQIAWMTSLLVFVVMLATYGRIELTLVSFIPMFIAFIWILGIMGLFGLTFNIVNIIVSALIFGLGDDYSLFIMDGLLQEYRTGKKNLASYKSSIVLSAITTLAGLGVLIFAKHPALRSIALISITGILSVVIIAQVLIPFLFHALISRRIQQRHFPWTFTGLFKSVFSLTYFAVGSLIMSLVGVVLIRLNPFNREKGKYVFHYILSKYTWTVMYIMGNVKKTVLNPANEDFRKPAVLIANHQSFLDILIMTMIYPKLVLLTNRWVWRSPVFGAVVRMADYYPVAEGVENSIELLSGRVAQGYSIVVFPEGTRTRDGNLKRFHKGAFYLAEKLDLDIVPVMIHGTAYTMSKGDFLLKDGRITIEFLPRIQSADLSFGDNYTERAKMIGRYFRNAYNVLRAREEQPVYYHELLFYNYVYKGPVLEWYLRIKLRLENNYQLFHELLPGEGRILDIGCGYGFMSYMLMFAADGRDITGFDYDEEKVSVANHCFSRNERIRFVSADAAEMTITPADGIILSDVLHYLTPPQQSTLIEKCMEHLAPGGLLLIRDGDKDLQHRHFGTKLTEFFSTTFSGFNKTSGALHFLSRSLVENLAQKHRLSCRVIDQTKLTSNIVFVIGKPINTSAYAV